MPRADRNDIIEINKTGRRLCCTAVQYSPQLEPIVRTVLICSFVHLFARFFDPCPNVKSIAHCDSLANAF